MTRPSRARVPLLLQACRCKVRGTCRVCTAYAEVQRRIWWRRVLFGAGSHG